MKKLNLILLFTITLINSNTYIKAINNTIKEKINRAIKKSRPNILNQYLSKLNLTQTEKDNFIELANSILEMRKTKMTLNNIIKTKNPPETNAVISFIIAAILGKTGISYLYQFFKTKDCECLLLGIGSISATALLTLMVIRDVERAKNFRTKKQKYLDALEVKQILKK